MTKTVDHVVWSAQDFEVDPWGLQMRKGLLTVAEAQERVLQNKIVTDFSDGSIVLLTDFPSFGKGVLPQIFIPVTANLPMVIESRQGIKGLNHGIIQDMHTYLCVFHGNRVVIHSPVQLADYLNKTYRLAKRAPAG